ncbi:MAG: DUF5615 family PIN-like protein [Planctomycetes bacterium]|nr:DUF5615 family PIN-like protein [Planctomycetota bacterium]
MKLFADENIPGPVIDALRNSGHDVFWAHTQLPGSDDKQILEHAQKESRLVLTCDRDFGELAFRQKLPASSGIILLRIRSNSPEAMAQRVVSVLESRSDWEGQFAVIEETRIRMRPLT